MIELAFPLVFLAVWLVRRDKDRALLLFFASASAVKAMLWPSDVFVGYSFVLDSAIFVIAGYLISMKWLSFVVMSASAFNFMAFLAETLLTSNALVLNAGAISTLGLFYVHYEHVMVTLSVAMLIASLRHGPASTVGINQRRDTDLRHSFKVEVS